MFKTMELRRFIFCVLFVHVCKKTVVVCRCPEVASTVGTNFVFGVPAKLFSLSTYDIYVHITTASDFPAHVRVTAPFINYDQQLNVHNSTIISLDQIVVQTEEGIQLKGIGIVSDLDISVAVIPELGADVTEGFLVLPTAALSTRYIAAAYQPYSVFNTLVLVVGTENNTNVFIKYKSTIPAIYEYRNVTLQKFETFQVLSNYDLSGAVVTSNKPVAVLSGSVLSKIPVGLGQPNYLVEQMIPTKYWVKQFIVPPIYPHNYFVVRIFVDENNTEIHCYNSTNHFAVNLDQGSMHEVMFGSDPAVIIANKPISVIQYCTDIENMNGNPFMTTVQGTSQYVNSYKFNTDEIYGTDSTLALTVRKNSFNGLELNGRNISSWNAKTVPVPKPMDDYMTVFINISYNSFYKMIHINGDMFGATLYGLLTIQTVYSYPLQLSFSTVECETESSTSFVTNTPSTTNHPDISTDSSPSNQERNGSWCMECDAMSDLQFCDKVLKCASENEMCYVQAYTRSQNLQAYRSGCIARNKCQNRDGSVTCQHSCEGDFCNTVGCGDPGLPDLNQRGPFCFDCPHQSGGKLCQAVQMCKPGQVCKIEQFEWGSGFIYTMGCAEPTTCVSKRSVHDVHARYAAVCSHCCGTDFCNMNCTSQQNPPIIG